jgi:hypothetical protein
MRCKNWWLTIKILGSVPSVGKRKHRVSGRASISMIQGRIGVPFSEDQMLLLSAGEILMMGKGLHMMCKLLRNARFSSPSPGYREVYECD